MEEIKKWIGIPFLKKELKRRIEISEPKIEHLMEQGLDSRYEEGKLQAYKDLMLFLKAREKIKEIV